MDCNGHKDPKEAGIGCAVRCVPGMIYTLAQAEGEKGILGKSHFSSVTPLNMSSYG